MADQVQLNNQAPLVQRNFARPRPADNGAGFNAALGAIGNVAGAAAGGFLGGGPIGGILGGGGLGGGNTLEYQQLLQKQNEIQRETLRFQMASNISKTEHDARRAIVQNMRG